MSRMSRFIVTIAPPTPNGDLHVGHLAGPYLAGDVFARLQRQLGHEVMLVSYADDYQSYMARKAYESGQDTFALARRNGQLIHDTLRKADIHLTHWLQAGGNPFYESSVRYFYEAVGNAGALKSEIRPVGFFEGPQRYGYEAWARGRCHHCGAWSDASQCEACACPPDMRKMQDFHYSLDTPGTPPARLVWHEKELDIFDIGRFKDQLAQMHARHPLRDHLKTWLEDIKQQRIDLNWPISRPGEHGVTLQKAAQNAPAPIIHTWFSGIGGYLAATREYFASSDASSASHENTDTLTADQKAFALWQDDRTRIVHFIGFDCAFSHALAYPAELLATGTMTTDVQWITNRFLTLGGEDFSTSRNHAIWIRDLLEIASPDAIRLFVASIAPEEEVSDFDLETFKRWNARWFEDFWPALLKRADEELAQTSPGETTDMQAIADYKDNWQRLARQPLFSMRALARFQCRLLELMESRIQGNKPVLDWLLLFGECGTALHPSLSRKLKQRYLEVMVPGA